MSSNDTESDRLSPNNPALEIVRKVSEIEDEDDQDDDSEIEDDIKNIQKSSSQPQDKDPFEKLKKNMIFTNKKVSQENDNLLENMRFITRHTYDDDPSTKKNNKKSSLMVGDGVEKTSLNYGGRQTYLEQYEISFELKEQLEHLLLIKNFIEQKFSNRTPEVNFFLDDSNEENIKEANQDGTQFAKMENRVKEMLKSNQGPFNATCLRDTWSKGKGFFFINKGEYLKVHSITENNKYAHCEFQDVFGMLHINDLRIYGHVYNSNEINTNQ